MSKNKGKQKKDKSNEYSHIVAQFEAETGSILSGEKVTAPKVPKSDLSNLYNNIGNDYSEEINGEVDN